MNRTAYAAAALAGEVARVLGSAAGQRALVLFAAACALGGLVAGGVVDEEEARSRLVEAGVAVGLPHAEARGHVRRGLRRGKLTPRAVPEGATPSWGPRPAAVARAASVDLRPPAADLAALFAATISVAEDSAVTAYLGARGLDPEAVALCNVARALPETATTVPSLAARRDVPWTRSCHRLLLPVFDAAGRCASVRARSIVAGADPKTLVPAGFGVRGLVLADPLGIQILAAGAPDWWSPHEVVIAEGDIDFLTWSTRQRDSCEQGPAVFGVVAGAWTQALADRLPAHARVVIRTHRDEAGEAYARQIHHSLAHRCVVLRGGGR